MNRWINFFGFICIVALAVFMVGCSDGTSAAKFSDSIDGTWQSKDGNEKLVIHFSGEKKSLELGSHVLPVTLKTVDDNTILINGTEQGETLKNWKLIRVWNSNGSGFGLALIHDGKRDEFVVAGKS